ncbi:MAG: endonuclease III [Acidobacteria bacterium]|nr:endonuclease III [Acidobacteriota bacterium]MBI3427799.1 endonuclease III [Acidobacteriota bacterium]
MKVQIAVEPAELAEKRQQLKYVTQNLEAVYGFPRNDGTDDPLDELIGTILSQATTNQNSQRTFANLKACFKDWEAVRRARPEKIEAAIKLGGLAQVKSVVIKNLLNEVKTRVGKLSLSFLHTAPIEEARDFLTSLPGVGPKTAACVLLFACKQPVFPMDTHIFRIARRLGLIPEKGSDTQGHRRMEQWVPDCKHYALHINMILHGRRICHARNPQCKQCCLIEHCRFGQAVL